MLAQKLTDDLKAAMKAGETFTVSTLRMVIAALQNKAKDKRAAEVKKGGAPADAVLTDEEVVTALRSEVKRRNDAAAEFEKGGRPELKEKELKEVEIIKAYLPAEVNDAEVETAVKAAVDEVGSDPKLFGKVMGLAMKRLEGRASGDRVSAAVKRVLGS